jgi:class 3 adenylate cyclase
VDRPRTRYARSGDYHIAFQVLGEGPVDLVYVPGWVSHLDLYWEEPSVVRFFDLLASFSRLIVFDKRGIGLSDPVAGAAMPALEERMDDVRAVLDAVGSERAAVLGQGYGCPIAMLFAASHPERVSELVLYAPTAKAGLRTDDYPWGTTPEQQAQWEETHHAWGTDEFAATWVARLAPSMAEDARFVDWAGRVMRTSASPATASAFTRMNAMMDVRDVLPLIRVPTLVLEREENAPPKGPLDMPPIEEAAWIAERIPGARLIVVPGRDYLPWVGDQDSIVDEVASFVAGEVPDRAAERVLLTVLFTDIVGSTRLAAELGDRKWREQLERHYAIVARELERHRGREVDRAGDGVLATFDGPARAIRCALALSSELRAEGVEIRAGVHAGEVELLGDRIGGIAVHVGARVMSQAQAGEVLVTSTVRDLVAGSGVELEDRGARELKDVEGEWRLFAAVDPGSRPAPRPAPASRHRVGRSHVPRPSVRTARGPRSRAAPPRRRGRRGRVPARTRPAPARSRDPRRGSARPRVPA